MEISVARTKRTRPSMYLEIGVDTSAKLLYLGIVL